LQIKRFKELGLHVTTWWCIAHRTNLALGDVLKENKEFIKFLRLVVAYTHNSAHKGQVNEKYVAILDLAEKMTALSASLDLKLANADPNDPDNDAEMKRILKERRECKITQTQCEDSVRILGRKRKLKNYLTVRWLSLFDTVDSMIAQYAVLVQILSEDAKPFEKRVANPGALSESMVHVNDWLAPALTEAERVKRASDELDNEADQEAGSSAPRKFHPGEKAFHLLRLLKEHYLFLCFLHEFGKHYRQLVKFYQHTSVPIAHLLYYEILIFQQHLFNLCLRFKEDEIEEQMGEAEAPAAGEARPKRISNAPRKHDLEKVDRKLYCTCQKMYDYDNEIP
jgi:hypothetical protein